MPLTLADLQAKRRTVAIQYDGDVLNVEYKPQAINPEFQTWLKNLSTDSTASNDDVDIWERVLAAVISWDILDAEGKPVAVSREILAVLPTSLLATIIQRLITDVSPNQMSAATSGAGSLRKGH